MDEMVEDFDSDELEIVPWIPSNFDWVNSKVKANLN